MAFVGFLVFYFAYVLLSRRHTRAFEALLEARIVAGLNSVNVLQHPSLLMSAMRFLETLLKDFHVGVSRTETPV